MKDNNRKKVNRILEEVLAIETSKREKFLQGIKLEDDIRREVESLLAFEEEAEKSLNLSVVEFLESFFEDEDKSPLTGQKVGVFEIIRELGAGGMGAVFLAERADGKFDQKVALKLLKREMNTAALRRRFQHEREILASLEHPNIARLIDAGTTEDRIPFIAMEYVEGVSINDYCNKNNLDLNERLDLFRKVCSSIDFAHRNLVVHRDLKPSNILVTEDGMPKLLDFGISKILSEDLGQADTATVTKMGVMTPSYASPEQLQKKSVTTATDIYSLGVILYELLSGHRPFEEKEDDLKEIYFAVIEKEPPLPSAVIKTESQKFKKVSESESEFIYSENDRSAHATKNIKDVTDSPKFIQTNPTAHNIKPHLLQGDLDNIILKALKKEPERRYSSAENLAADIERHQKGLPVTARPDTFSYRAGKFIKRNSFTVAAGALILLAVFGGIVATLWQARIAEAERAKAEKRFNDVRKLANSFLFEITPKIENVSGTTEARELLVKRALEYLDSLASEAGDDAELQRELAAAYEKVGNVQGNPFETNIGDMQGALNSYEKARTIRENLLAKNPGNIELKADLAKNLQLVGDVLFFSGETDRSSETYSRVVEMQKEIFSRKPHDREARFNLASAQAALGSTLFWNSKYEEALSYFYPAKETLEDLLKTEADNDLILDKLANVYVRIGETLSWKGDEGGLENILKGLDLITTVAARNPNNGKFRKTLWTAHLRAGEIYLDLPDFENSLKHYEKSLEIAKEITAEDPKNIVAKRDLALSYNKVGDTLDSSGNGKAALENAEKALKLQQEIAADDPKNFEIRRQIASTFKRMGYAQTTMKDFEASRESFQNARRQYENLYASDPTDKKLPREIAIVTHTIGETYLSAAEQSSKKENLQKALDLIEKSREMLLKMKADGTLPEFDDKLISDIEKQIADIKLKT